MEGKNVRLIIEDIRYNSDVKEIINCVLGSKTNHG